MPSVQDAFVARLGNMRVSWAPYEMSPGVSPRARRKWRAWKGRGHGMSLNKKPWPRPAGSAPNARIILRIPKLPTDFVGNILPNNRQFSAISSPFSGFIDLASGLDRWIRTSPVAPASLALHPRDHRVLRLRGYDGLRVHRSYWVAHAAIERAEKAGRRVTLHLVNGMRVPVSRRYAEDLKAQGWLGD